ncbi:Protein-tyrosine phosphatase/arsenate reductase [Carpediemonas membranifera]|uniref:acid phosphatase n=1 Tax=Carpediemonas membranifera TaxID=201153 RepID=A0A8J6BVG4_9EUKA|nr:Protein-tyrosine phosphatase/arsenate reductase [Carpediemonas membranifera]|eukprot:KAG9391386.1 Protein-tyrosine phosphatase/arsenate reductase [Carpediemonas membranifera]
MVTSGPKNTISVLFVCLGNICRSPTADGVFGTIVKREGLAGDIKVDSCGTAAYHVGESPDSRSAAAAKKRGYDLSSLRARQLSKQDFRDFDYILAMDDSNLSNCQRVCPKGFSGHLSLFTEFSEQFHNQPVPDPYYGGANGFNHVLDIVEDASKGLLKHITENDF